MYFLTYFGELKIDITLMYFNTMWITKRFGSGAV